MSEEIITETQVPDIAALVEFIAKSLVDEPSEVKVAVKADEAGEETTIRGVSQKQSAPLFAPLR